MPKFLKACCCRSRCILLPFPRARFGPAVRAQASPQMTDKQSTLLCAVLVQGRILSICDCTFQAEKPDKTQKKRKKQDVASTNYIGLDHSQQDRVVFYKPAIDLEEKSFSVSKATLRRSLRYAAAWTTHRRQWISGGHCGSPVCSEAYVDTERVMNRHQRPRSLMFQDAWFHGAEGTNGLKLWVDGLDGRMLWIVGRAGWTSAWIPRTPWSGIRR